MLLEKIEEDPSSKDEVSLKSMTEEAIVADGTWQACIGAFLFIVPESSFYKRIVAPHEPGRSMNACQQLKSTRPTKSFGCHDIRI